MDVAESVDALDIGRGRAVTQFNRRCTLAILTSVSFRQNLLGKRRGRSVFAVGVSHYIVAVCRKWCWNSFRPLIYAKSATTLKSRWLSVKT